MRRHMKPWTVSQVPRSQFNRRQRRKHDTGDYPEPPEMIGAAVILIALFLVSVFIWLAR